MCELDLRTALADECLYLVKPDVQALKRGSGYGPDAVIQ
jgi:hypothetical protein